MNPKCVFNKPNLSELRNDTLLFVDRRNECHEVISKEDFISNLVDENYLDGINSVHIAESEVIHYNFKDYIETIGEDAYDDWDNQVWDSIKDTEEYKKFNELMLNVINSHKVYYPGQMIYIDYKGE